MRHWDEKWVGMDDEGCVLEQGHRCRSRPLQQLVALPQIASPRERSPTCIANHLLLSLSFRIDFQRFEEKGFVKLTSASSMWFAKRVSLQI